LKTLPSSCINLVRNFVPDSPPNQDPKPRIRRPTLVAAGLLLAALALVVLPGYTTRGAFFSPVALVVVAAIGVAALLLQIRLRPGLSSQPVRGPLWLNGIGVLSALAALVADFRRAGQVWVLIAALVALVSFGISGIVVLSGLRKRGA
jgi:peptidoglycan/LPS O-acetylase OafA/YrhL